MSAPYDLDTYDGYRHYLEHGGNAPHMVDEILAVYFPATGQAAPGPVRRQPPARRRAAIEASGQLALDLTGTATAAPVEAAAPTLFALTGEHPAPHPA